jgi:cytochrome c oxidase subunit I+III
MRQVTRSVESTTAPAAAHAAAQRKALPNGWWGAALLVATEATLFGTLIASLPLALAGALVTTTIPMFLADAAARAGRRAVTAAFVAVALAVQSGYLAVQIIELKGDLDSFTPRTGGAYASAYYTLLVAHHAHVLLGILINVWLLSRLATGLTNYRIVATRVAALYWYFVAAVGVVVTLTIVSPSL